MLLVFWVVCCLAPAIGSATPLLVPVSSLAPALVLNYHEIYHKVYRVQGYHVCKQNVSVPCWLQLVKQVDCVELFQQYSKALQQTVSWPPPKQIPEDLKADFLLSGNVKLSASYHVEGANAPDAGVTVWDEALLNRYRTAYKNQNWAEFTYQSETTGLIKALTVHSVAGLKGSVFGSQDPWVEALLFEFRSAAVTTIEFRKIRSTFPQLTVLTPKEWAERWLSRDLQDVDFAVSFSSLEHDGLGRYGDPVNPFGDVQALERLSCHVKSGGMLFLAVPTAAADELVFNAHRFYGPFRWPLLTANWRVLGMYYKDWPVGVQGVDSCDSHWLHWAAGGGIRHPVVVLQNTRTQPCERHS